MTAHRRIQRFEVLDQLGSGGTGQVYRAHDPELERDVAIKMLAVTRAPSELSPHDTLDLRHDAPVSRDDLLREARMMAQLSHQNVLPVYEVGLSDGAVFLVMEHIDGADLSAWLEQPRTTDAIVAVFLQAARGLLAAHQRGIVHRDIKPSNILVGRDGRVRVGDFGLSRLTARSPAAMMYLNDGRGTPRYMAPELWRGESATVRSDVYALCLALVEALGGEHEATRDRVLRGRGIRPALRELIDRGLADDPAARPELPELIAALEDGPPRWRNWAIATAATSVVVAAVIAGTLPAARAALSGDDDQTCDPDPAQLAARWDARRFDAVTRVLVARAQPGTQAIAEVIAGDIDVQHRALNDELTGACKAARARDITRDQYRTRASCLQRRAFEITATVDLLLEIKPDLLSARDRIDAIPPPSYCVGMAAPAIADPAAVEALWRRYVHSAIYEVPTRWAEHVAELTSIAEAAAAIGETELVARSRAWIGNEDRVGGELEQADDALQRAYRIALDLKSTTLAAQLLTDRATVAILRDDAASALNFTQLARDIADNPTIAPRVRARIYLHLGRAFHTQGDHKTAIEHLRHALAILNTGRLAAGSLELRIRDNLIAALTWMEVPSRATVDLALDTVELARAQVGEVSSRYAATLHMVGAAFVSLDDYPHAIPYQREAAEILAATVPADNSFLQQARAQLAFDLYSVGDLEAAQRAIAETTAVEVKHERFKWSNEAFYALVAFQRGALADGLARGVRAQEEAISAYGRQHPQTLELRRWIAEMQIEMHQLDEGARNIAAIEDGYRTTRDGNPLRVLRVTAELGAQLSIERGAFRDAEAAARHALRAATELHATDHDRGNFHAVLGKALVAQRRWAEARSELEVSRALLGKVGARADDVAAAEIDLAIAEVNLDDRGPGLARARRARKVLDEFPGRLRARSAADRLLGAARPPRPRAAR